MKLSVCMIVKNEESCLERCLGSVKGFADEIIVVDTGSTDNTKSIAGKFTEKIFDFKWENDFAKARNFSLSKATGDWILVMDADEVIDKKNRKKITEFMKSGFDAAVITQREYRKDEKIMGFIPIDNATEFTQDYKGYTATPTIRLFRKDKKIFYEGKVHEDATMSIAAANLIISDRRDIYIHHYKEEKGMENFRQRQLSYLKILEGIIKDNPKDAYAHYKIAGVYDYVLHDYEKCLEHLEIAYGLGYSEKYCLIGIGGCLLSLKREEEALQTYIKALSKGFSEPVVFYNLYRIYYSRKDYPRAKMVLEKLVKLDSVYKEEANIALEKINSEQT